ncbi:MAG: hypothetical protein ACR2RF_10440 [Geminicoccaceae bacterium]
MAAPIVSMNGRWGGKLRDQNLDTQSGDDVMLQVTVLNIDGSKKDITSATILWNLSRRPGLLSPTLSIAGTITDATNGVFQVAVTGTGDLRDVYYHEAEITESGGAVGTVIKGWFMINRDTVNA